MSNPTPEAIERVMAETGMQYIQARNHLISRALLANMPDRRCGHG